MTGSCLERGGLATGPQQGVLDAGDGWELNPDEIKLAEVALERGYVTACCGKWHRGNQPEFMLTALGLDERFGMRQYNDIWPLHP